jgi:hypothetical protein
MFDAAALVLEEIAPEDRTVTRFLGAHVYPTWRVEKQTWSRQLPAIRVKLILKP